MVAEDIAKILLDVNAVKLNVAEPFTLTSGLKSPMYTDNRILISYPHERNIIVRAFADLIKERGLIPEYLAGTATAGIPWAAFLAQHMDLPMIYVRSKPKGHGAGKQIEGHLNDNSSVLIIEDLITTGGSAMNSVNAIRNEGKSVCHDVFAIYSQGLQKSTDTFIDGSVALSSLTDAEILFNVAQKRGILNDDEIEKARTFIKDPEGWLN